MAVPGYDVIVLGLGGMGSAAAAHLARRGFRTLGIEQFGLVHALGSSHGHTRLIRRAYFEHPDYVPLLHAAYGHWRALESETAQELMVLNGLMMAGASQSGLISGSIAAARQHQLELEILSAQEARTRFPDYAFSEDMRVLFDPEGGFLHVERGVRAHLDSAQRHGATLLDHVRVQSWASDGRMVKVVAGDRVYEADTLVICAGAWSGALFEGLDVPLAVERAAMGWFRPIEHAYQLRDGCPVFAFETPTGFFYGSPQFDDRGIKVAEHRGLAPISDPGMLDRRPNPADLAPVQAFIPRHLPGLNPVPLEQAVCMYTMSPDSHFIVDTHPEHANVHIAGGFSGHGYKFAPVVGAILADLAESGSTSQPTEFLSLKRFSAGG
jgi:sarcosine oxidase